MSSGLAKMSRAVLPSTSSTSWVQSVGRGPSTVRAHKPYISLDLAGRFQRGFSQQEWARLLEEALYSPDVARDLAARSIRRKPLQRWLSG